MLGGEINTGKSTVKDAIRFVLTLRVWLILSALFGVMQMGTGNNMAVEFIVKGPYELVPLKAKKGILIDDNSVAAFWSGAAPVANESGLYLFALRRGRGYTPFYVGKADKQTFKQETFTPRNVNGYLQTIVQEPGTPVFFFLCRSSKPGPLSSDALKELEKDLIGMAYAKNPNGLINRHHAKTKEAPYAIKGVINCTVYTDRFNDPNLKSSL